MGAFSLPIGLTGNLFNLWGLVRDARTDEPLDPPADPIAQPIIAPRGETVEETAERRTGTRGTEQ